MFDCSSYNVIKINIIVYITLYEEQSNVTSPCGRDELHWPERATENANLRKLGCPNRALGSPEPPLMSSPGSRH